MAWNDKPPEDWTKKPPKSDNFVKSTWRDLKSFPGRTLKDIVQTGSALGEASMDIPAATIANLMVDPKVIGRDLGQVAESAVNYPIEKATKLAVDPKGLLQEASQFAYDKPAQTAAMLYPAKDIVGGAIGGVLNKTGNIPKRVLGTDLKSLAKGKIAPEVEKAAPKTSSVSELIKGKLQKTDIENLANPKIRKDVHLMMGMGSEEKINLAAREMTGLADNLRQIKNKLYAAEGITQEYPIRVVDSLVDMRNQAVEFSKVAIGKENRSFLSEADEMINDMTKNLGDGEVISFGQLKQYRDQFQAKGDQLMKVTQHGEVETPQSRLFHGLAKSLNDEKLKDPVLAKISSKYSNLSNAQDMLHRVFNMGDPLKGELAVERALNRRSKDIGNIGYKNDIEAIGAMLEKYPETKELAGFVDRVKAAQTMANIDKAEKSLFEMPGLQGFGLRTWKKISPIGSASKQYTTLADLIDQGKINPDALFREVATSRGFPVPTPLGTFRTGGTTATHLKALKELYKK